MTGTTDVERSYFEPLPAVSVRDQTAQEMQRRCDVADEMLAKLIDDIGTGPGLASIRRQALDIKHELRGLIRERHATAP